MLIINITLVVTDRVTCHHPSYAPIFQKELSTFSLQSVLFKITTADWLVWKVVAEDTMFIKRAAQLANMSAGFTSPHLNFDCIIATPSGRVSSVVIGLRHPLSHLQGNVVPVLRSQGLQVDVLQEDLKSKIFEEKLLLVVAMLLG
ncbi:hypothetical protein K2173_021544 [Erythroxylum novogranatense]|uniref:Uncharacterized protein n=1 Tax=Erythroxylum novogranatense TaxID=1862640 RepID=A0AAV8TPL0_9ROSI|nr:hypothetical protein K2173_021544 [Erythroxylum novogranatense]